MRISLLTDAPRHNLALMRLATYYKEQGHEVKLNEPLWPADFRIGSWLFTDSPKYPCDEQGGPATPVPWKRLTGMEDLKPDYSLFNLDHSVGYTWEWCPRRCPFCVVPKMHPPKIHRSIWDFHDHKFKKIEILNNNWFSDPQWKETFEEIWDADLTVIEHGFDLRLLDEEKAEALKRTKFERQIHFAWDRMQDEREIIRGLQIAKKYNLDAMVYVLIGFDTTLEEDLYRCQKIHDLCFDPFPMIYNNRKDKLLHTFRRFIYLRYYKRYRTIAEAWADYGKVLPILPTPEVKAGRQAGMPGQLPEAEGEEKDQGAEQ